MATNNTKVVYIDTNLDTHLALVVSDIDTVSDLKKSILSEHPLCFPEIGQIQIHRIKVKRRRCFYHLTDSMPVKSAFFRAYENGWFLSVDVSVLRECAQNEQLFLHGSPNRLPNLGIANNGLIVPGGDAICSPSKRVSTFDNFKLPQLESRLVENEEIPVASPCVSEHTAKGVKSSGDNDNGIPLPGSIPETEDRCVINWKLPSLNFECEVDGSAGKGIKDRNVCEETSLIPGSCAENRRKGKRKKEDTLCEDNSKDATAVDNALSFPSKSASGANNELPGSCVECEVDGTDKGIKDACIVHEEGNYKSVSNVKKKLKSKRKKEDTGKDNTSKVIDASVVGSGDYTIQQDTEAVANPSEDVNKVVKETGVLKEHQLTDCNNNNNKNDADAAASMQEVAEHGSATNKKHKKRKRPLIVDSKEMFNVETAIQKDDVEYMQDHVVEDNLVIGPPAKKKRKGKEKSGEKCLSKAKFINDFNVHNASHHILEDQQKIKNSNADQSAEHFDDNDPLKTSVQDRRKKGKKNSSNPRETPVVTSSRKDEEADRSSIQRGVQEKISEDGLFSKDISMSKATIDNMETETDACKEGFQSTERTAGNFKNQSNIKIKANTADVDKPMELTENNENVVLDGCHKNEAGQVEGTEKGRQVSPQNDPKLMLLEKSTSSNQDKTDATIRELNVTWKVGHVNGMTEPIQSEKEKRSRKAKNSGGRSARREGIDLVDASESETIITKSLSAENCDLVSGNTETENPLNQIEGGEIQQEKVQGTSDKEDFTVNNVGSLEQIKTKSNAEHTDKRQRKKSNNKQTSTSKSISNMLTKDQVLDSKKSSPSSDSETHGKPSAVVSKKNKSTSTKSTNKSRKTNLEPVEDSVRLELSDSRFNFVGASRFSTGAPGEKDGDKMEAINGQTNAEDLSSKEELDVRKGLNVHRTGLDSKLSGRSDSPMSLIGENRKAHVNVSGKSMDLEKRRKHVLVSTPELEGSIKMIQNKAGKTSGNNVQRVASKTQQKKSLLSGAIFKDDSSSTSEDEVDNSDISTRTPLLSDFSDGDSSSGSYGGRNLENGARSSMKTSLSGIKGLPIDQLVRSSSRFKKARTTASQFQDTQSQPEFVPDSLAE